MSAYGKDLIRNTEEFDAWVKKTTGEVLNEGCEDKDEITDMLIETRPDRFPVVGVWVYYRRIHQIFVEWVFPSDFGDALPPVAAKQNALTSTVNSESPDSEKEKGGAK